MYGIVTRLQREECHRFIEWNVRAMSDALYTCMWEAFVRCSVFVMRRCADPSPSPIHPSSWFISLFTPPPPIYLAHIPRCSPWQRVHHTSFVDACTNVPLRITCLCDAFCAYWLDGTSRQPIPISFVSNPRCATWFQRETQPPSFIVWFS